MRRSALLEAGRDGGARGATILNHHHRSAEELRPQHLIMGDGGEVGVVRLVELLDVEGEVRLVQTIPEGMRIRALLAEVRRCGADARAARGVELVEHALEAVRVAAERGRRDNAAGAVHETL